MERRPEAFTVKDPEWLTYEWVASFKTDPREVCIIT